MAVNGTTGAVVPGFVNNMSGGIGVNALLTVQQFKLTHDTKLLVVHTGRKIADQDRYGVGLISTQTNQLLPWRTRLWDDNLQFVGGIQRVYAGDIAPNDQYFVVGSGSGGDRPPINDTAIAFPVAGNDNVQPLWVSAPLRQRLLGGRHRAGGVRRRPLRLPGVAHRPDPWPGLDNVGYTGRAWPATASATPWSAATTSAPSTRPTARRWSGTPAPTASRATRPWRPPPAACSRRRRHVPGRQEHRPGRLLRLQHRPRGHGGRHHHHHPDRGPGGPVRRPVHHPGPGHRDGGQVRRVQVEIQDRNTKQYSRTT